MNMMKPKKLFRLLSVLVIAGCTASPKLQYDSEQLERAPRTSVSSVVIKEGMECYYPVRMAKYDSLFLVQDFAAPGYVNIFDSQGEYVDCLIKKGHGHTEIDNMPTTFSIDRERGIVSVFAKPYVSEYDVRGFLGKRHDYCSKTNCSALLTSPVHDVKKMGSKYLLVGFAKGMRFTVADEESRSVYTEYPQILPESNDEEIAPVLLYASREAVSPDGSRWVQATYIGAVLEIFEYKDNDIRSVRINPIYRPVYEGHGMEVSWGDETTIGFDDVVVTDKYIYTLLNGTFGKNLKSNPPVRPFTNEITIFDWNGNIRQIISTDCMMMAIDIDEKEDVCYAMAFNMDRGCDLRKIPLATSSYTDDN